MTKPTSQIIYGCMGLGGGWNNNPIAGEDIHQANSIIDLALELGITIFDHADIYTFGKAETVFGEVLKSRPELRQQMTVQTKCGIRFEDEQGPKRYDFSEQWINFSIDKSLKQLHIEQIDTLLLHRPDPLADMDALANTLHQLEQSGKVKQFGVSNMHPSQLSLLQSQLSQPLVCNQVELSLLKPRLIKESVMFNTDEQMPISGLLSYCQQHKLSIQAWGSLANGKISGVKPDNPHQASLAAAVSDIANRYEVSCEAILLAWLMAHPVGISPVIGTTSLKRIRSAVQANDVNLSKADWYTLFERSLGHELP